jgi:hypothetical protein
MSLSATRLKEEDCSSMWLTWEEFDEKADVISPSFTFE